MGWEIRLRLFQFARSVVETARGAGNLARPGQAGRRRDSRAQRRTKPADGRRNGSVRSEAGCISIRLSGLVRPRGVDLVLRMSEGKYRQVVLAVLHHEERRPGAAAYVRARIDSRAGARPRGGSYLNCDLHRRTKGPGWTPIVSRTR